MYQTIFSLFPCSSDLLLRLGIEGFKEALKTIDFQPFICHLAENDSIAKEICELIVLYLRASGCFI